MNMLAILATMWTIPGETETAGGSPFSFLIIMTFSIMLSFLLLYAFQVFDSIKQNPEHGGCSKPVTFKEICRVVQVDIKDFLNKKPIHSTVRFLFRVVKIFLFIVSIPFMVFYYTAKMLVENK